MLLQVLHQTRYDYSPAVDNAHHVAHLQPLSTGRQTLLRHTLRVHPQPAHLHTSVDVYGNTRHHFGLHTAHSELVVDADSLVQTSPDPAQALPTAPWERVRARYTYQARARWDAATEFVFPSPCIPREDDFADFARPSFAPARPVAEAAWDLMQRIHRHMRYEAHSTQVSTPALQALRQGAGVCQDFAHILVACCRAMGLPARYVSGYLLTTPPPGQARLIGSDASHAWAQVYCPLADGPDGPDGADGAGFWLDLDPTNDRSAGEDYVTLATGRDFLDVSPMRGVIHGGAAHVLSVAVTVRPAEEAAAVEAAQALTD